jgi:hypothetical protein
MPARDTYHDVVKRALLKDGWTITHDPLILTIGTKNLFVDLGAQRLIAAEKGDQRIAVEVKGFTSSSEMRDLETAHGQYVLYGDILQEHDPERTPYLALPNDVEREIFDEPIGKLWLQRQRLRVIFFDPEHEVLLNWIP